MTSRIFQVIGAAYSTSEEVTVELTFNNKLVYSGPVTTISEDFPDVRGFYQNNVFQKLFEFTDDISLTGKIPFSLKVTNGSLFFQQVLANYSGIQFDDDLANDPSVRDEDVPVLVQPQDFYGPVSKITADDDGRQNIKINGVSRLRNSDHAGPWNWIVRNSQTFACELLIDPDLVITQPSFN